MKRKFFYSLMLSALTIAPALMTSCKDYDDDISRLEGEIGKNTDAITAIQNLLKDGVIITNIAKSNEGITITTSDMQTWVVTNGKDGKDGENGLNGTNGADADVWTIGNDGYWYKNGSKTDYKAIGQDGQDGQNGQNGQDGQNGQNGQNGQDGVDGGYYVPNADGYFYYVAMKADGTPADPVKTDISWTNGNLSAIKTLTGVIFYGVEGYPNGFTISTIAELKSLVFKPQLVVDGVNAINAGALTKNGRIICTPNVVAEYHLNPSTVAEQGINTDNINFVTLTKDYVVTRAISDVTAEYESINNGVLKVGVNFKGSPSEGNKIDLVALQVENAAGEIITSDYATIYTNEFASENLIIARGAYISTLGAGAHYWLTENDAKNEAITDAQVNATPVDKRVILVPYNSTVNLYDEIKTCLDASGSHRRFSDAEMEAYHLSYKFSKISSFKVEGVEDGLKTETDQQQFINLDDNGVVTPKTYQDGAQLRSSIGRTPIVKATLVHKEGNGPETVLEERYVVLKIVDKINDDPVITEAIGYGFDMSVENAFQNINFCADQSANIWPEQMNSVYSKLGISHEQFSNQYEFFDYSRGAVTLNIDGSRKTVRSSQNVVDNPNAGGFKTNGLTWTLTAQEIWDNAGKTPTAVAIFKKKTSEVYVVIYLSATSPLPGKQVVSFPAAGKYVEYWEPVNGVENARALINVRVPNVGENTSTNCTFTHDLTTFFTENPLTLVQNAINASNYKVDAGKGVSANSVKLIFKSATCPGYNISVTNNGQSLTCNGVVVATLNGTVIDLMNNDMAKTLLNTNDFVVTYSYDATFTSCLGELDIPSSGATTFQARFVRPINVASSSPANFKDGEDFGKMGATILDAGQVINIVDWRGKAVQRNNSYWGYYGIQTVTVDNSQVTVTFPSTGVTRKVTETQIKAGIFDATTAADPDLQDGFTSAGLTAADYDMYVFYKNNGGVLKEQIVLHFPVVIEYVWGKVTTQSVDVKVDPTTIINKPANR